jgi:TnpA family transposase
MVAGVEPDTLAAMIQRVGGGARFRIANDAVVAFMRRHAVARLWGRGLSASADMMSLDATRYLWNARLDPRRKGPAIATYPHVLDQWPIFYDQPIILGKRQAGAAIEGALRQTAIEKLERVAVDTHGFTHFAMAVGKFCGFDLCPRLAGIRSRKLYLLRGYHGTVPDVLKPIVSQETISQKTIARGWESNTVPSLEATRFARPAPPSASCCGPSICAIILGTRNSAMVFSTCSTRAKRFTACGPFNPEPSAPGTAGRPSRCRPSPAP